LYINKLVVCATSTNPLPKLQEQDGINFVNKIQGGSNMTGTDVYKQAAQVAVIFEQPCMFGTKT
jgi:hypothetical protein